MAAVKQIQELILEFPSDFKFINKMLILEGFIIDD